MYELLVLSLLMHWPLYAYLVAEISNHILGPWERISRGTLSSLLARLEKEGLIALADQSEVPFPSDRPSKVFAITPAGRQRFYQLMMDTTFSCEWVSSPPQFCDERYCDFEPCCNQGSGSTNSVETLPVGIRLSL